MAVQWFLSKEQNVSVIRISNSSTSTVSYALLKIAGPNAFNILKENLQNNTLVRRDFLKSLAEKLCKNHMQHEFLS